MTFAPDGRFKKKLEFAPRGVIKHEVLLPKFKLLFDAQSTDINYFKAKFFPIFQTLHLHL